MANENEPRVYGMADQANRDPPAAQGMRGAKASTRPRSAEPDLSHKVTLDSGKTVTVSEGSGVAFAEATGRAGRGAEDELDISFTPEPRRRRWPLLLGALAAGIAGGAWLARRARAEEQDEASAEPRVRLVVIRPAVPMFNWRASRT